MIMEVIAAPVGGTSCSSQQHITYFSKKSCLVYNILARKQTFVVFWRVLSWKMFMDRTHIPGRKRYSNFSSPFRNLFCALGIHDKHL